MNCRSIRSKIEDIRKDYELFMSDMICLSETWLNPGEQLNDLQLDGYSLHVNSVGPGKGLATYFKDTEFQPEVDVNEKDCQLSKFTSMQPTEKSTLRHITENLPLKLRENYASCVSQLLAEAAEEYEVQKLV